MVTHCVCHNLSFSDLRTVAAAENLDFHALQRRTGCATNCGRCEPYIRLMLATGQTRFPVLPPRGPAPQPPSPLSTR